MPGFDPHAVHFPLFQSHFIEASAGTGKTYTIEQLVLRFLLEAEGPQIDQILIVTFTRAAVAELKTRIRNRIKQALEDEKDTAKKKKLVKALVLFDESKIFTIHGFCFQMLKEHAVETGFPLNQEAESASFEICFDILKDFLRTELSPHDLSQQQLEKILKGHQNNVTTLVAHMVRYTLDRTPIKGGRCYSEVKKDIFAEILRLKQTWNIESETLLDELKQQAVLYKGCVDRQKKIKAEIEQGLQIFAALFDQESDELVDLPILNFVPENRLKRELNTPLLYPAFIETIQAKLLPLLEEVSDPLRHFAFLAEKARIYLEAILAKKDLFFFEDLLKLMEKHVLGNPSFAKKIREQYRAVLVDEFQDTDPTQWRIFSSLFLTPEFSGPLYLVGDPKQAIYAFRGADVYTYMQAKNRFSHERILDLTHNYRSTPQLVSAINLLFSQESLFELPKLENHITYKPLFVGHADEETRWEDGKGCVHFCIAEKERALFSFIYNEIRKLHQDKALRLNECAVLVKDRFQAERFIQDAPFATRSRKREALSHSAAFLILCDVLKAANRPQDRDLVSRVLAGPLFEFELTADFDEKYTVFAQSVPLLRDKGLLAFFNELFMQAQLSDERIYAEILELIDRLVHSNGDQAADFLFSLSKMRDEELYMDHKAREVISDDDAVQVMTTHSSKGLEFSVVFPIGMALDLPNKPSLVREGGSYALSPALRKEEQAESMRQLYVAFTRAKRRVYAPLLQNQTRSPMQAFLANRSVEQLASMPLISFSVCHEQENIPLSLTTSAPLIPPKKLQFSSHSLPILSYSALASYEPLLEEHRQETLPAHATTGIVLHRLFEELPFAEAANTNNLVNLIQPYLEKTSLSPHVDEVAQLIREALHTPLPSPYGSFLLAAVEPHKMIKEMEFLYPAGESERHYFRGFIDLFFEYEQRYYLLDWKSNALSAYSEEHLHAVMERHQYLLQAKIYHQAVKRYLALFGKEDQFVGTFYFFLRGPQAIFVRRDV